MPGTQFRLQHIYSQHPLSRMPVNSNIRYLERIFISLERYYTINSVRYLEQILISPEGSSYRMLTVYVYMCIYSRTRLVRTWVKTYFGLVRTNFFNQV